MQENEIELFEPLYKIIRINENNLFKFYMNNGDVFIVKFDGEGPSEYEQDEDTYLECYGVTFLIEKVVEDVSKQYCDNAIIEINVYDWPEKIEYFDGEKYVDLNKAS